jgi:phage-related minor tail protein
MGLISSLEKVFEVIYDEAEKEWTDESKCRESLNELYVQLESGEITEEAYDEEEERILAHLKLIREYKKEHGYV